MIRWGLIFINAAVLPAGLLIGALLSHLAREPLPLTARPAAIIWDATQRQSNGWLRTERDAAVARCVDIAEQECSRCRCVGPEAPGNCFKTLSEHCRFGNTHGGL